MTEVPEGGPQGPPSAVGEAARVVRVHGVVAAASTTPAEVETADGLRWVMKFAGAGPGPAGLLTEFLALGIARAFGAPVPAARPLWLPEGFPWMAGTDEFDAMLQRSYGWNLGIRLVPGARVADAAALDAAVPAVLGAIAQSDRFLQNMDRTAANPNLLVGAEGLVAIDYDACLYLSRALGPPRPPDTHLPVGHLLAGRDLPMPAPPATDVGSLVAAAPDAWYLAVGAAPATVAERLAARLAAWRMAVGPGG